MMNRVLNIAIDGPAGAGKSTVAKAIAKKLDIVYLDTGAMYRGAAYFALEKGISPSDADAVKKILPSLEMDIVYERGTQKSARIRQGRDSLHPRTQNQYGRLGYL